MTISTTSGHAEAPAQSIAQRDERFNPNRVVLKRGQSLQVTNEDRFVHHVFVEAPDMKYDSGEQRPGRVLTIPFEKPGEFVLECAIHLKMKLRVTVEDK
jgi:plastocyanin